MTDPLTPPDCDLRDFAFMPLDVVRLRDSDMAAIESAEVFRAAVLLWCASWHQVPAGSIPNDDRVLSNLAGFGRVIKEWQKVKSGALRGWIECSDGRLYHKVVAEKALESHESKLKHAYGKMCERLRKANKARSEKGLSSIEQPTFTEWNSSGRKDVLPPEEHKSSAGNTPENALKGTEGTGNVRDRERKGQGSNINPVADATAPSTKIAGHETELQTTCRETWKSYSDAYFIRYQTEPVRNSTVNSQVKSFVKRIGAEEAPHVAAFFVQSNSAFYVQRLHSFGNLLADAEKVRTEWATGSSMTNTRARQIDQSQANASVVGEAMKILEGENHAKAA